MRVRSPRWGTVSLPHAVFRACVRPLHHFTHGPRPRDMCRTHEPLENRRPPRIAAPAAAARSRKRPGSAWRACNSMPRATCRAGQLTQTGRRELRTNSAFTTSNCPPSAARCATASTRPRTSSRGSTHVRNVMSLAVDLGPPAWSSCRPAASPDARKTAAAAVPDRVRDRPRPATATASATRWRWNGTGIGRHAA